LTFSIMSNVYETPINLLCIYSIITFDVQMISVLLMIQTIFRCNKIQ